MSHSSGPAPGEDRGGLLLAVFDSGPLIYLDALGYLSAIGGRYRMLIPEAVTEELSRRPGEYGGGVPGSGTVECRRPATGEVERVASGPPAIDEGEREVIALALETGAAAIIDDRRGAKRAAIAR